MSTAARSEKTETEPKLGDERHERWRVAVLVRRFFRSLCRAAKGCSQSSEESFSVDGLPDGSFFVLRSRLSIPECDQRDAFVLRDGLNGTSQVRNLIRTPHVKRRKHHAESPLLKERKCQAREVGMMDVIFLPDHDVNGAVYIGVFVDDECGRLPGGVRFSIREKHGTRRKLFLSIENVAISLGAPAAAIIRLFRHHTRTESAARVRMASRYLEINNIRAAWLGDPGAGNRWRDEQL